MVRLVSQTRVRCRHHPACLRGIGHSKRQHSGIRSGRSRTAERHGTHVPCEHHEKSGVRAGLEVPAREFALKCSDRSQQSNSYRVSPSLSFSHGCVRELKRWRSGFRHEGSSSEQALIETCSGSTSNSVRTVVPQRVQKFRWIDLPESPVRVYRVSGPVMRNAALSIFMSVTNGDPLSRWQSRQWQKYT
jgi:hypothetical protein